MIAPPAASPASRAHCGNGRSDGHAQHQQQPGSGSGTRQGCPGSTRLAQLHSLVTHVSARQRERLMPAAGAVGEARCYDQRGSDEYQVLTRPNSLQVTMPTTRLTARGGLVVTRLAQRPEVFVRVRVRHAGRDELPPAQRVVVRHGGRSAAQQAPGAVSEVDEAAVAPPPGGVDVDVRRSLRLASCRHMPAASALATSVSATRTARRRAAFARSPWHRCRPFQKVWRWMQRSPAATAVRPTRQPAPQGRSSGSAATGHTAPTWTETLTGPF